MQQWSFLYLPTLLAAKWALCLMRCDCCRLGRVRARSAPEAKPQSPTPFPLEPHAPLTVTPVCLSAHRTVGNLSGSGDVSFSRGCRCHCPGLNKSFCSVSSQLPENLPPQS